MVLENFKTFKFKTEGDAFKVQEKIRKKYGYKPSVFKVGYPDGSSFFEIVKPKSLIGGRK